MAERAVSKLERERVPFSRRAKKERECVSSSVIVGGNQRESERERGEGLKERERGAFF